MKQIYHGINRAQLDRILIDLGGEVIHLRRTGEVQYRHRLMARSVRSNGRRKSASREQSGFVMDILRIVSTPAANDDKF